MDANRKAINIVMHAKTGFSVEPATGAVFGRRGRKLNRVNQDGYLRAAFRMDGHTHHVMLHRVVWESVHGPIAQGMEVNHVNGIKDDNRIANLELVTRHANIQHAYRTGLNRGLRGERSGTAKLTRAEVESIRSLTHLSQGHLARLFGISRQAVGCICRGETWKE